jgi:hypothetical protein
MSCGPAAHCRDIPRLFSGGPPSRQNSADPALADPGLALPPAGSLTVPTAGYPGLGQAGPGLSAQNSSFVATWRCGPG